MQEIADLKLERDIAIRALEAERLKQEYFDEALEEVEAEREVLLEALTSARDMLQPIRQDAKFCGLSLRAELDQAWERCNEHARSAALLQAGKKFVETVLISEIMKHLLR
jgi:histidinol-phosphate/aromatic aminotransferase/cobyric acid decarboxylase-like protein